MDCFFASINGKWLPWEFTDGQTRSASTAPKKLPLNLQPPPREVSSLIHNDNSVSFRTVKRYIILSVLAIFIQRLLLFTIKYSGTMLICTKFEKRTDNTVSMCTLDNVVKNYMCSVLVKDYRYNLTFAYIVPRKL